MRDALERISEEVRDVIWELPETFDKGLELGMGADGTPTSNIDKIAEEVLINTVNELDLPFNILSEEAGFIDRGSKKTLVVDPIDGTYNAVSGLPVFSVSLAVGTRSLQDVEYGLVRNLANDDLYYAEKGAGAFLNERKIRVRPYRPRSSAFMVYMGKCVHPHTLEVVKTATRTRSLGCASLEMCMVAEGRADAQYMNCEVYEKSIRVVDIAASALILREAGGQLLDLN